MKRGKGDDEEAGQPHKRHGSRQTTDEITSTAEDVLKAADGACKFAKAARVYLHLQPRLNIYIFLKKTISAFHKLLNACVV